MLLKPELNSFVLKPKRLTLPVSIFSDSNLSNFKKLCRLYSRFLIDVNIDELFICNNICRIELNE